MFDRPLFQGRLWTARQGGDITHACLVVGLLLSRYANRQGRCWPAMDTLAAGSGSCVRTVQRAVNRMRDLGLLTWQSEWTTWNRRDSNRYTLLAAPELADKKEKTSLRNFPVIESGGSRPAPPPLPGSLAHALEGLASRMGIQPERAPGWLVAEDRYLPTPQWPPWRGRGST